jgi:hypothetical protein
MIAELPDGKAIMIDEDKTGRTIRATAGEYMRNV